MVHMLLVYFIMCVFFSSRRRHTRCALVTGVQTCALPIFVNAAGPAVLDLLRRADAEPDHRMRLVRGSHIVVRKLFEHDYAYFFQLPDGRIFFAIPYERDFTLIGTTDQDHDGPASEAEARDRKSVG